MPAVLIEIGYLTNPLEDARLNDKAYLNRIASIMADAISEYHE
jgi:N-acetylmuramoyl-L-alanine amidase